MSLSDPTKQALRAIAKESIRGSTGDAQPSFDGSFDGGVNPELGVPAACFVTLRTPHGELRGCMGMVEAAKPVALAVAEMARAAANRDPRFAPVAEQEVDDLRVSITVLGPRQLAFDPMEIEIGRHGLIVTRGEFRGLLLPQVAVEQGWDPTTFLEQTCRKAGLPADAWRATETKIETFTGEVF